MGLITQSRVVVHPQSVCGKQWFRCAFDFASVPGKSGIPHHGLHTQHCAPFAELTSGGLGHPTS